MENITDRFIECYRFLLSKDFVKNAGKFAETIEISPSMMTEISKKRSGVGLLAIQNTVLKYPIINAEWLLTGSGEMLRQSPPPPSPTAEETATINSLRQLVEVKEQIIEAQEKQIAALKATLELVEGQALGVLQQR